MLRFFEHLGDWKEWPNRIRNLGLMRKARLLGDTGRWTDNP